MKISVLNSFGADREEWSSLEKDLLELLDTYYGFSLNEDDCGHKLQDVLKDADLEVLVNFLFERNQGATLNQLAVQEIGYASTYHDAILLGEFMLVGDGDCPFCGSNDIRDVDGETYGEHDQDENSQELSYQPPYHICQSCQHEWSTEE